MRETGSSQPCMVGGHSDSAQKLSKVLMRESMDAHKSTFHTEVRQAVEQVARRVCAVSVLGDFQDLTSQSLEKVSLNFSTELALSRRLGHRHPKVPSNLNYSVILFCNAQSQNNLHDTYLVTNIDSFWGKTDSLLSNTLKISNRNVNR